MAFAMAEQDVARYINDRLRAIEYGAGAHLREKCFLHVGHSYGRSLVSEWTISCAANSEGLSRRTRSLMALNMLKLGELAVTQTALLQGHEW